MTGLVEVGGCIVAYNYQLIRLEPVADTVGVVLSYESIGLLTDPSPSNGVGRLREGVNQAATMLANEILKAQQAR